MSSLEVNCLDDLNLEAQTPILPGRGVPTQKKTKKSGRKCFIFDIYIYIYIYTLSTASIHFLGKELKLQLSSFELLGVKLPYLCSIDTLISNLQN